MEESSLIEIRAIAKNVIYRSEESGYTVIRVQPVGADDSITVVGCLPFVGEGEELTVSGFWVTHPAYGEQFRAEYFDSRLPAGAVAMEEYLASGFLSGVGKSIAHGIVSRFGDRTFEIMETEPARLSEVHGISKKRAALIGEAFSRHTGIKRLIEYLIANRLPPSLSIPLYRAYGNGAVAEVRKNPYLLVSEDFGLDFSEADRVAVAAGIPPENRDRIDAGILFELSFNADNGHAYIPERQLIEASAELLGVPSDLVGDGLSRLIERSAVAPENVAGKRVCYLESLYEAEAYIAMRLSKMLAERRVPPPGLSGIISSIETEAGVSFHPLQRRAIEKAASSPVFALTGGPGTGKTTTIRGILSLFSEMDLSTALAAPTGRAAKRMSELTGRPATTVHRLIGIELDPATGRFHFTHDEDEPLNYDAVVVDEMSMVDLPLMRALLAALPEGCRLVMVGDPDQLPSVGPGSVFGDILKSGAAESVRLTEIFRQAKESGIVTGAHAINGGELPPLNNKTGDFFFIESKRPDEAVATILGLCGTRLPSWMGIDPMRIQVLSATRRRATGTDSLNARLQEALNPPDPLKQEKRFGKYIFREGDKVMQIRNNYDIIWLDRVSGENGIGIFNGDIGRVLSINHTRQVMTVDFDEREAEYEFSRLYELEPAYAMTVHKSQGSEYDAVVLAALEGSPRLMCRPVLYTAVTRAKRLMVIVGSADVVSGMVMNDRRYRRYSALSLRLSGEV